MISSAVRFSLLATLVVAAGLLAGCKDDTQAQADTQVTGTAELASVCGGTSCVAAADATGTTECTHKCCEDGKCTCCEDGECTCCEDGKCICCEDGKCSKAADCPKAGTADCPKAEAAGCPMTTEKATSPAKCCP